LLKGACENLVKTRGYHNTWIALLDEEGKLETCAEADLGKAFLPMIELFKRGKLTTCSQKALKQQEVVITENPLSTCAECPLAQKYSGGGAMTIRLEYNGKVYGLISVSIPTHITVDQEEQSLFKEVAGDIAFALRNIELDEERKQTEEKLQETYQKLKKTMNASIETMSKILEAKDPYTSGHQQRVSQLATAVAKELNLSPDKIEGIRVASLIYREDRPAH
jgi:GAF domain-containing protein